MINRFIKKLPFSDKLIFFSGKFFNKIGVAILEHKNFKFWQHHYNKLAFRNIDVDFDGNELHYKKGTLEAFARKDSSDSLVFDLIFMQDEYKPITDFFLANNIPFNSFIDLGANIGLTSLYIKKIFPDATVIAVEPDKNNYSMLVRNFNLNKLSNATALHAGVGKKDCYLLIEEGIRDKKDWAISFQEVDHETDTRSYSIVSLLNKYELAEVDFIKMDIEGAEKAVFEKDADLSFLNKVKVMAIEIHDEFNIRNDIYEILKQHNFILFNTNETTIAVKKDLV